MWFLLTTFYLNIEDLYNREQYSFTLRWTKENNLSSLYSFNGLLLGSYQDIDYAKYNKANIILTTSGKIAVQLDNDNHYLSWFYCEIPGDDVEGRNYKAKIKEGCLPGWCK